MAFFDMSVDPSTVFAAFNHWGSPDKEIHVYRFNGHEGGSFDQSLVHPKWLRDRVTVRNKP